MKTSIPFPFPLPEGRGATMLILKENKAGSAPTKGEKRRESLMRTPHTNKREEGKNGIIPVKGPKVY